MWNKAKNVIIEIDIFIGSKNNADDIEEDIEEKDGENLDLAIADSYLHAIAMTRMYSRKRDVTDYLKSSILSHLYHSLSIADDANRVRT